MIAESLLSTVKKLSAKELQELLERRQADDKALRVLWRAAVARERAERRQGREGGRDER
jgi:hypothetical protein